MWSNAHAQIAAETLQNAAETPPLMKIPEQICANLRFKSLVRKA